MLLMENLNMTKINAKYSEINKHSICFEVFCLLGTAWYLPYVLKALSSCW